MKFLPLFLLLFLSNCSVFDNEQYPLSDKIYAETDKLSYDLSETIVLSIKNDNRSIAQAYGCGTNPSFIIQKKVGASWINSDGLGGCIGILSFGYFNFLEARSTKELDYYVHESGEYRIGVALAPKAFLEPPSDDEYTFSNTFIISN